MPAWWWPRSNWRTRADRSRRRHGWVRKCRMIRVTSTATWRAIPTAAGARQAREPAARSPPASPVLKRTGAPSEQPEHPVRGDAQPAEPGLAHHDDHDPGDGHHGEAVAERIAEPVVVGFIQQCGRLAVE